MMISPRTRLCAVAGNPIGHSMSPVIHNAAYAELGLDFVYVAFRVEDIGAALTGMRAMENFRGMSITIPHKISAMKHVDEIADVDQSIGSINTVIHENDRLIGFGTDGPGALKALTDARVELDGKHVLMLGAGGAARAIAFTLAQNCNLHQITILDIDQKMLHTLAGDLSASTQTLIQPRTMSDATLAAAMPAADIIIHCTPIGMHPKSDASLIPADLFRTGQAVFDIVYTPLETKLLKDAKSKGLKTISGVEMFVNQAVLQFERFTGVSAPAAVMRNVVVKMLG
ncbi:MAG: shikimate dehydrogenase [Desulfobacterales bacterium]|nr:shikimate dehydrogenase [Desulfobacterales bacterium]